MFTRIKKLLIFALSLLLFVVIAGCSNLTTSLSSSTTNSTTETNSTTITTSFSNTETSSNSTTTSNDTTTSETSTTTTESSSTTTETTTILTTTTTTETTTSSSTTTVITTQPTTTFTTTTTAVFISSVEVVNVNKDSYEVGEAFLPETIEVVANLSNGIQATIQYGEYTISGFNSSTAGVITVTISYQTLTTYITLTITSNGGFVIDMAYYQSAQGLSGNALISELRTIINRNKVTISYDDARYILDETDRDPNNSNNLILVYTRESVPGAWNYPVWNREHVWPQSLLNTSTQKSDLQNLKPSDVDENGFRGNKYFDNVSTSSTYEPHDDVKGDIARILFYMVIMYSDLELVNHTPSQGEMALLNVLLSWHEADPVDDFERNRNDVIYSYQKNRNPFIDYPEFVDLIW